MRCPLFSLVLCSIGMFALICWIQWNYSHVNFRHEVLRAARSCPSRTTQPPSLLPFGSIIYIYYLHARPDPYLVSLLHTSFGNEGLFTIRETRVQFVPYVVSVSKNHGTLANASLPFEKHELAMHARTMCPHSSLLATIIFLTYFEYFNFLLRERPASERWFIISEEEVLLVNQQALYDEVLWCVSQIENNTDINLNANHNTNDWKVGFYLLEDNQPSCRYGHGTTLFFVERLFLQELVRIVDRNPSVICTAPIDIFLSSNYHFFKHTGSTIGVHVGERYKENINDT